MVYLHFFTTEYFSRYICYKADYFFKLHGDRSLIFGPVVEKPNSTAFLTRDPTDMILNREFSKVPILAGYTSHEGLLFECRGVTGANISSVLPKPEEFIPSTMKTRMDDRDFDAVCSEMETAYGIGNSSLKRCLVRIFYLFLFFL